MRSSTARAALALTLFSGWLALLFWGFAFGGGVHLLLAAGLALFPWRAARARTLTPPTPSLPSPPPSRTGREGA
jgi:membrane protein required for beta-lactamase induction